MTSSTEPAASGEHLPNLDTSTWDPALDAVVAAPGNHKVLFENDKSSRTRGHARSGRGGAHASSSMGAQCSSSTRCKVRFMTSLPKARLCRPTGTSSRLCKRGMVRDAWWFIWRPNPLDAYLTPWANLFTASASRRNLRDRSDNARLPVAASAELSCAPRRQSRLLLVSLGARPDSVWRA
jgi:hypothetical protein